MLIATIFTVAEQVTDTSKTEFMESVEPFSFEDDVPVWEVGDSWTYAMDNINFIIDDENLSENLTITIQAEIANLTMEVIDDTGDLYQLQLKETEIVGDYSIFVDFGDGPVLVEGELRNTDFGGIIYFNKSDLGIVEVEAFISGRLTIKVEEQPYFDLSLFPKIPVAASINGIIEFDTPYPLIDFPINVSKLWGLPATNISIGGTVESPWFNLFNFINTKIRDWELIEPIAGFLGIDPELLQNLSDLVDEILPVVDIEYILTEVMDVNNTLELPEIPPILHCNQSIEVTVPAGTFTAYEITVIGGGEVGRIYYAPDVGNIIKIEGDFSEVLPFLSDINMQLTGYT
jgi:hypothetical protein